MSTTTLETTAELVYRVRRGAPRSPLIVLLHGLSGDENVMWLFESALPKPAMVISPRAPYASGFGGYSWTRSAVPRDLDRVDFGESVDLLRRFVPEMIRQYQADAQRVIALGFSQGAALSYALSLREPALLCGVIALAGFMPDSQLPEQSAAESKDAYPRHGYLILHGLEDEDVPIERARQARSDLAERGAPIVYHEYSAGHKIPAPGIKEIRRWLHNSLS